MAINFSVPSDLTIQGNLTAGSLNGVLKGTAGLVSAATPGVDYSTAAQLTSTGVTLGNFISLVSGNLITTGVTLGSTIASTGQQAWLAADNNGRNLSGNLTQTGIGLIAFSTGISGALYSQINAAAGVLSLNGATGTVNLGSAGTNLTISVSGTTIFVSGTNIVQSGDLTATGVALVSRDAAISGGLQSQIGSTGQLAWLAAQNNAINLSGNLGTTGSILYVIATGLSGQFNTNFATTTTVASTGQQAWSAANNNGINLSGNLTLTGQIAQNNALNLSGTIALTGQQAWAAANNNGINLSGSLLTLSGFLFNLSIGSTIYLANTFL